MKKKKNIGIKLLLQTWNKKLKITNILISEANVGIAVKDGSKAMLSKVNLKNN